jgi:hypothetical protein
VVCEWPVLQMIKCYSSESLPSDVK